MLARRRRRLGALILSDRTEPGDPANLAEVLANAVAAQDLRPLPWTDAARQLQARVALMRGIEPDGGWPDLADAALRASIEDWLPLHLAGITRLADLQKLDLFAILRGRLSWEFASRLDRELPSHLNLPTGRARIDYTESAATGLGQGTGVLWPSCDAQSGRRPYPPPTRAFVSRRTADRSDGGPRRLLERGLG